MAAAPAVSVFEIIWVLFLALLAVLGFITFREAIYRALLPLQWIGINAWAIASGAADGLRSWAEDAVRWIVWVGQAWLFAPARNLWEVLNRQWVLDWWMVARMFAMRGNIVWLRSAVGDWPGGASLTSRVTWVAGAVDVINTWRQNFENWVNQQLGILQAAIAATAQTLANAIESARREARDYTNAREVAVRIDMNNAVALLQSTDQQLHNQILDARDYASTRADQAESNAKTYADQKITYTAEVLRAYTDQRISELRMELLDRLTAVTTQLQLEIEGVRDETRLALMQLVNDMARMEAALSAEIKARTAELTAELERTRGELTTALQTAITDVMREIQANRNRVENYMLIEAAALMELAGALVGALPEDVVAHIRRVAEEAQAMRTAAAAGMAIAIASVAARAAAIEAEFARLRRQCIDPTCRAWLPSALLKGELNDLLTEGVLLAMIISLLRDPVGTAAQLRAFAEPVASATWAGIREFAA